jgi:AraC-like DNA-binding protein
MRVFTGVNASRLDDRERGSEQLNIHSQLPQNAQDLGGGTKSNGLLLAQPWKGRAERKCRVPGTARQLPGSVPVGNADVSSGWRSVLGAPFCLSRLLASAGEETGRLTLMLQQFKCSARLCSVDGHVTPLWTETDSVLKTTPSRTFTASIASPEGYPAVTLELCAYEQDPSDSLRLLLSTLIRATANAVAERWFRGHYRSQWVVLAMPVDEPDNAILLALDRDHGIIGANASARQMLEAGGRQFSAGLSAGIFFREPELASQRRYCDKAVRLHGATDARLWAVMTTPPATYVYSEFAERDALHTRPRHDMLRSMEGALAKVAEENGLPPRILRHIEEFIDSHLDWSLSVDELASSAGISISHFSKCFRNSVGLTPHSYVMRRRLLRAQDLLLGTNMALSEVALSTGFSDQSHFSRKFHQFMGLPPRSFRLQHR